jgi:NAD(P)-dependent dehydrogenase (short-subunit alcohol dehydrogenase family)
MNRKYCLVTGATHGIGTETARALAVAGAHVLVHGRDLARARGVAEALRRDSGNPEVHAVQADFARLADIRRLAQELCATLPRLDVLINNAGMMSATRATSAEGYDLTLAVNHLAPFLLTACGPARIVVVASDAHRRATLDFDDLMNTKVAGLLPAYARSKLANVLFVRALARRLADSAVTVNALHPGFVSSHLFHDHAALRVLLGAFGRPFMLTPAAGARTSIYLATSPQVEGMSGGYYARCRPVAPSAASQSDVDAERLWQASARLTGLSA